MQVLYRFKDTNKRRDRRKKNASDTNSTQMVKLKELRKSQKQNKIVQNLKQPSTKVPISYLSSGCEQFETFRQIFLSAMVLGQGTHDLWMFSYEGRVGNVVFQELSDESVK